MKGTRIGDVARLAMKVAVTSAIIYMALKSIILIGPLSNQAGRILGEAQTVIGAFLIGLIIGLFHEVRLRCIDCG